MRRTENTARYSYCPELVPRSGKTTNNDRKQEISKTCNVVRLLRYMVYERHRIVPYFYFMLLVLLTTGSTGTNSNVLPTFVHCQYHDNNGSHVAMHHVPRPLYAAPVSTINPGTAVLLKLTTVFDDNLLRGFTRLRSDTFNLINNFKSLFHFAEHNMLSIQPRCINSTDEEL